MRASDPSASEVDWGHDAGLLVQRLRRGLERSGIPVEELDRVVSGASGSRSGDRLEAEVLAGLFGDRELPPVLAPKAVTGEYGGGFLAAALLSAAEGATYPTPGFESVDPGVDETLAPGPLREAVALLAERKALAVAEQRSRGTVIAGDTVVEVAGEVLGKPRDAAQARTMLGKLSGTSHRVHTGVALVHLTGHRPQPKISPRINPRTTPPISITRVLRC